jgi:hypothetical protein
MLQELDKAEDGENALANCTHDLLIHQFFLKKFTPESFFECFAFINGFIDYKSSTHLGQFYCRSLYANLCLRMYLVLVADMQPLRLQKKDTQEELLQWVDTMATLLEYKEVERLCFAEKKGQLARQKKQPSEPIKLATVGDRCFIGKTVPRKSSA